MPILIGSLLGCSPPDRRPSVVLIVADTLRADAVSAYGAERGTTPTLDAMADGGLRYTRVYAPSSWTLPSHASLFTGQGVDRHRVGMHGRVSLPEEFVTLAERFEAAGYETAAFSENMLVSDAFQMLQGFRHRAYTRVFEKSETVHQNVLVSLDPVVHIGEWIESRPADKPFFVFVNLFEAHSPYAVREENPWVPADATPAEMNRYAENPQKQLCGAIPSRRDLDVLRGLYLGDVADTDRTIAQIFALLEQHGLGENLIRIVTSDHGELFGERNLLGHEFNLRQAALHVPLIVSGVGAGPAVLDQPVTLVDVAVSILQWAGLERGPDMDGVSLPLSASAAAAQPRPIFSAYSDAFALAADEWGDIIQSFDKDVPRVACGPGDKVFGGMASVIEYPFKYQWFERYEPELYDLSWDAAEQSDQLAHQPEVAARLAARLERFLAAAWLTSEPDQPANGIGPEEAEALKALGYAD